MTRALSPIRGAMLWKDVDNDRSRKTKIITGKSARRMTMDNEEYLYDGVYVSFDGYQYCLRAPRDNGDHVVYLEPYALAEFDLYRKRVAKQMAEQRTSGSPVASIND